MKCKTIIDSTREEEVLIYAHEKTALVSELERLCAADECTVLGISGDELKLLSPNDIYCFFVDGGRTFALCEDERFLVKERLYRLEEKFGKGFIKINQSSIVNINKIERFSARFSGTLEVILKNGYSDFVSRRQLKAVKERLGLK